MSKAKFIIDFAENLDEDLRNYQHGGSFKHSFHTFKSNDHMQHPLHTTLNDHGFKYVHSTAVNDDKAHLYRKGNTNVETSEKNPHKWSMNGPGKWKHGTGVTSLRSEISDE